jgi:hypothetical protein
VGQVASEIVEDGRMFWGANEKALATFSNTPDVYWKQGSSAANEKPTHWFHLDFYSEDGAPLPSFFKIYREVLARYSEEKVKDNGTGTWRVEQFFAEALSELKAGRYETALQFAGAMSHYVGDLSQPLHVTQNYDGQLTDQKGIHAYFETENLERADAQELRDEVLERAKALLQDRSFRSAFDSDLMRTVLLSTNRSLVQAEAILQIDNELGRSNASHEPLLEIAKDRLADGAATYALLLSRLWREGGQNDANKKLTPQQPRWVAPDYSQTVGLRALSSGRPKQASANSSSRSASNFPCEQ